MTAADDTRRQARQLRDQARSIRSQTQEIRAQTRMLAAATAAAQDQMAGTIDRLAEHQPHRAERLRAMNEPARRYAARGRRELAHHRDRGIGRCGQGSPARREPAGSRPGQHARSLDDLKQVIGEIGDAVLPDVQHPYGRHLSHAMAKFARTLARGPAVSEVLNDLAERLTVMLDVAGAGVSVLESGQLRCAAATERAAGVERAQEAGQAGPCVDACRTGMIVTIAALPGTAHGWGAWQQAAQDAGIVAVAAIPMRNGEILGAVNLYSAARRDWSADDLGAAVILADMATGYLVHAQELARQRRLNQQLRQALDSRIVIEQAKGALAAERHIPVGEAFEMLRRYARSHSASLRSVAQAVVSQGLRP